MANLGVRKDLFSGSRPKGEPGLDGGLNRFSGPAVGGLDPVFGASKFRENLRFTAKLDCERSLIDSMVRGELDRGVNDAMSRVAKESCFNRV